MAETRWLEPRFDNRQSFYRKAKVVLGGGEIKLYSYETLIATYDVNTKELQLTGYWDYSQTTLRHLRDFLGQYTKYPHNLSKKEIYETLTEEGREEVKEKALKREELKREREEARRDKEERTRLMRELRAAKKAELKASFTKEFEGILSKSEINKLVMQELDA